MNKLTYLLVFLFIAHCGYSQTIINAERLSNGTDSTIYAIAFSYAGTRGNSNVDQLDIAPTIVLMRKKNTYQLFGGYNVLSDSDKGILNSGFVHIRHNYILTERIRTFEFYQIQFNEVLLLTKRQVFGAGLRLGLVAKDSLKFDIGLGLMREVEILNKTTLLPGEPSETKYYRATCLTSFKWIISRTVQLNDVVYYQPYLKDFADYRLLNDFNLVVSITDHFKLITALTTRYDSQPPGTLKPLDNVIRFGFNVKF